MTGPITDSSPRVKARIAGLLYLAVIITAGFAEGYARGTLVVSGDAGATATNILAHQTVWRLGGAADLVNIVCDIALALILYELLTPVSRSVARLSSVFRLMGDITLAIFTLDHFAPLLLLGDVPYSSVFSPAQIQAQAYSFIRLHAQGYNVAMVFFGCHLVVLGYLTYRSTFLPRFLGALLAIAGLCYLFNAFARFISPSLAAHLSTYIFLPGIIAEVAITLWFLIVGVNIERWRALQGSAGLGIRS